ncbi:MAG: beta-glucosidase [Clostridiales Family XIII bacterium]|jgi:beta-glucosidase|nr:beta-glucosidase [Clostridiales Family XIII bacterium]
MSFPKDFVWGSATASYQIEGGYENGERGRTVWDDFCDRPGTILDGSNGSVACDHYHRYKEDVQHIKDIGFGAYRLSIAWARLLPEGTGKINEDGVRFYNNLIDELLEKGITPYITLFHWDLPYELFSKGGWQNPECVEWFAEYTELVAKLYGDRVKHFFTFNEPQCFIGLAHVLGIHAPGNIMSKRSVLTMAHNVLKAHGRSVQVLRALVPGAQIGIAPTSTPACPETNSEADINAAREAYFDVPEQENYMWSVSWWSDPIFFGQYPEAGLKLFEADLPDFKDEDFKLISEPIDFYGQNIYNGYTIKAGANAAYEAVKRPLGFPRTAINWPVVPESLYWGPKFLYERYKKPIFITENGQSGTDFISLDGKIHDTDRIDFTQRYLAELERGIADGTDVKGYFAWSLIDNFEWHSGYTERFGLIHVDYQTQKRTWKDSAHWMKEFLAK